MVYSARRFILSIALCFVLVITKTCLYNVDSLKPHFYIATLGFAWIYIIFLISAQKYEAVLTSTHNLCFEQKYEKYLIFCYLKLFLFWCYKFQNFLIGMFSSFYHCDYLVWGRESWSECFSCIGLLCACWFVSLSFSSCQGLAITFDSGTLLRKHAYSNILKISQPNTESFPIKILILFIFQLKT